MTQGLFALLRNRMVDESVGADEPVAVAELHRRLLPYQTCRERLGFATKAEYDAAVLHLLADERLVTVTEPALREAVHSEIRQPEPGLAFLHRFAASEIRLRDVPPTETTVAGAAVEAPPSDVDRRDPAPSDSTEPEGCRVCRITLPAVEGVRFCPSCGADQVVPTCASCGAEQDAAWRYCAYCGELQGA